ncbi:sperm-associated microtubule inner protein 4 [Centroberyx gerrardi]
MEANSPRNYRITAALRGHHHLSYGGAVIPENVTVQQHYDITATKKSNVRLNDQLIPKPTDINIAEKMIKVAIPKEHPYSSHISRFAMFPSFRSPDDPDAGVRAASQPILNPLIPTGAPEVTVLSKTIGGPYRHEILEMPMASEEKALMWTGEQGFLDHTKPVKGESQVFYPSPPKTVFPNPKLRNWDISLSERTTNKLKNVERTHWLTSYQMHYTGSGPANPLKIDDFNEKISDRATGGMTSHTAQLRERSYPAFVPSKPREGRRREGSSAVRSAYRPTTEPTAGPVEPLYPSPAPNQDTAPASILQHKPQEITAKHNETPDPNPKGRSQAEYSSHRSTEAKSAAVSQEVLHKQQPESKNPECEIRGKENRRVQFDEGHKQVSLPQTCQETNAAQATGTKIADAERSLALNSRPLPHTETEVNKEKSLIELCYKDVPSSRKQGYKVGSNPFSLRQSALAKDQAGIESDTEVLSRAALEQEKLQKGSELLHSISTPCILPRPPVLPCIHPVGGAGTLGGERPVLGHFSSLLDLQDSFSKSEVHRNFNSSIVGAAADLRDNICMGKKHNFYGINCSYLHG